MFATKQQIIDLKTTWHNWQSSQMINLTTYHLTLSLKHRALLAKIAQHLEDICVRLQQTNDKGLVTKIKRFVAVPAKKLVKHRLFLLNQQIKQQQQRIKHTI